MNTPRRLLPTRFTTAVVPFALIALLALALPVAALARPQTPVVEAGTDDDDAAPRRHGHRHRGFDFEAPVPAGVTVPAWDQLGAERQQQLAHLRAEWDRLPASRRVRALERLERRARWEALSPEERARLREGARNFHELSPELREKMRTSFEAVRALPEAERERLLARWRALDPQQRRRWLEAGGPGIVAEPAGR